MENRCLVMKETKLKCLIIYLLVSQNIPFSNNIYINNILITHDVLHGRRHNSFNYNYKDWETVTTTEFDYNIALDDAQSKLPNYDVDPWWTVKSIQTQNQSEITTPVIYVTISTTAAGTITDTVTVTPNPASTITDTVTVTPTPASTITDTVTVTPTPASTITDTVTVTQTPAGTITHSVTIPNKETIPFNLTDFTYTEIVPTLTPNSEVYIQTDVTLTTVAMEPETIPKPLTNGTTESTTIPQQNATIAVNETTTTELIMTFPETTTVSELTTLPSRVVDYVGIHYPKDMTFPSFGPTQTTLEPLPPEFTWGTMITVPPKSEIRMQFERDMEEMGAGAFTTFLYHIFQVIATKEPRHANDLLLNLETEVVELQRKNKLSGFGKSTQTAIMYGISALNNAPIDVIQDEAALGDFLIKNRHTSLGARIVELFNEADAIYIQQEEQRIEEVVEDLHNYPNTTKTAREIAHDVIDAVLMAPMKRVYGTAQEKLMVQQLDALVVELLFSGHTIHRRQGSDIKTTKKRYVHHIPRTTTKPTVPTTTVSTKWTLRSRRPRTSPLPLTAKMKKTSPTTIPNIYRIYSKNETIKKSFQKRMKKYKQKRNPNAWKRWRSKYTTTTTTTETTPKVKRGGIKSIYVIKKYVNKTLKKRKTRIVKNETDDKLITREMDRAKYLTEIPTLTTISLENKVNSRLVKLKRLGKRRDSSRRKVKIDYKVKRTLRTFKKDNIKKNNIRRTHSVEHKRSLRYKSDRVPKRYKILNRAQIEAIDSKKRRFELVKKIRRESSITDEESKLRANLDDAFFHANAQVPRYRKVGGASNFEKKMAHDSSFTDEEAVLKSKIYKAFGYGRDFGRALRHRNLKFNN